MLKKSFLYKAQSNSPKKKRKEKKRKNKTTTTTTTSIILVHDVLKTRNNSHKNSFTHRRKQKTTFKIHLEVKTEM